MWAATASAQTSDTEVLANLEAQRDACVAQLPSKARRAFQHPAARRRLRLTPPQRRQWQQCTLRERDLIDQRAIYELRDAMMRLVEIPAAAPEAERIAQTIVTATREKAQEFNMIGSPLLHNFLIKLGAKKGGYCYEWTRTFIQALQGMQPGYFAWHWGVANFRKMTENNGLILTANGAPIQSGIVYDAWRGAGNPWWRPVTDDHYKWEARFKRRGS